MSILSRTPLMGAAFALLVSCAGAGASSDVARFGAHEGVRFVHEVAVNGCTLTETQWEKRDGGTRVLWEETQIDLRGAEFMDLMASVRPKGEVITTTMLDATDHPEKPYASITLLAHKTRVGKAEALGTRRMASAMTKRGKTTPSARGRGDSHVFYDAKQVLILFRDRDAAPQVQNLEAAINAEIERCSASS